jgi:hypothetical protein
MDDKETLRPPWEVDLVRKDGKVRAVTIRAAGEAEELDYDSLREASSALLSRLRTTSAAYAPADARIGRSTNLEQLRQAYGDANGRMTPDYLAQLATAYEELAGKGRAVIPSLAFAIGKPAATVKRHVMRARQEGLLTPGEIGKEGGTTTDRARELVAQFTHRGQDGATVNARAYKGR